MDREIKSDDVLLNYKNFSFEWINSSPLSLGSVLGEMKKDSLFYYPDFVSVLFSIVSEMNLMLKRENKELMLQRTCQKDILSIRLFMIGWKFTRGFTEQDIVTPLFKTLIAYVLDFAEYDLETVNMEMLVKS